MSCYDWLWVTFLTELVFDDAAMSLQLHSWYNIKYVTGRYLNYATIYFVYTQNMCERNYAIHKVIWQFPNWDKMKKKHTLGFVIKPENVNGLYGLFYSGGCSNYDNILAY